MTGKPGLVSIVDGPDGPISPWNEPVGVPRNAAPGASMIRDYLEKSTDWIDFNNAE